MKKYFIISVTIAAGFLAACNKNIIKVPDSPYPISKDSFTLDTIAQGFTIPYGIAIVKNDEYFITDRIGRLFHLLNGDLTEIMGMPEVVTFGTPGIPAILHGGLMDVSLHPDFSDNSWIYISYLNPDGLAMVSRFKIKNKIATDIELIFQARKQDYTGNGMRIVWENESHFFLNIGNSNLSTTENPIMFAQDLNHDAGKIHRLKDDGSVPIDNPIFEGQNKPTTIWSYGHRDVQGLYHDNDSYILYGVEHGPQGGDEFNIIRKGKNYGWPLFSEGINYDGARVSSITRDSAKKITVLPEHFWTVPTRYGGQAIAPACLLKVDQSNITEWNEFFLMGSLAYRRLMKYNRETKETFGINIEGRVRTIKQLPGGDLIALIERNDLTKSNGMVVRISN